MKCYLDKKKYIYINKKILIKSIKFKKQKEQSDSFNFGIYKKYIHPFFYIKKFLILNYNIITEGGWTIQLTIYLRK